MGLLDDAKDTVDEIGDRAEDVFEAAKRKAAEAVDQLKDRLDVDDDGVNTVGEVFAAAQAQASGAIENLKDRVTGDDSTPVGEATVVAEPTTPAPAAEGTGERPAPTSDPA